MLELAVAAVTALWLTISAAAAATIILTGEVTGIADPGVAGPLAVGDAVTFRLGYAPPPGPPTPFAGSYFLFTEIEVSFKGNTYALDPFPSQAIFSNDSSDSVELKLKQTSPIVGIDEVGMLFSDPTGLALHDAGLFTDPAALLSMNGTFSMLTGIPVSLGHNTYSGRITAVAAVAETPIPAALPLLMSALGGLGILGWRRGRKHREVAEQSPSIGGSITWKAA